MESIHLKLGWRAVPQKGCYASKMPALSADECGFILSISERFSKWAQGNENISDDVARGAIKKIFDSALEDEGLEIDSEQREYLLLAAKSHLLGYAPFDSMLSDPAIEEIALIEIGKPIHVYIRKVGWMKSDATVMSLEHLVHIINKMSRMLGRRITSHNPRLNALLPNGSRLHASIPPISLGELTIRLHGARPWSIYDVLNSGSTNASALALLWLAFQSDSSVLIAGNTSSGKTTLLNALFTFVPLNERVVLIEETPELRLLHEHKVLLVSSEEFSSPMPDLVRDSLRMRPDRVIVGEVRTPLEAEAFAETLLSGQARGSYATFHAQSAHEALRRLANLGISQDDLSSLDFIIIQRRISQYLPKAKKQQEARRMLGIYMVEPASGSGSGSKCALAPVYEYSSKSGQLIASSAYMSALERISSKLGISPSEAKKLHELRRSFLLKLKEMPYEQVMQSLQKFALG